MGKWDKFNSIDEMTDEERKEFEDQYGGIAKATGYKPARHTKEQLKDWLGEKGVDT